MSILHQHRWSSLNHCLKYLAFVEKQDSLVIYGEFSAQDQHELRKQAPSLTKRCYWLSKEAASNTDILTINHQQWLTLITEHDKTQTWK